MSTVITAIYEDGVLKPLQDPKLKEHEKVDILITADSRWQREFNHILKQIHRHATKYPSVEIEGDITAAASEVQRNRRSG